MTSCSFTFRNKVLPFCFGSSGREVGGGEGRVLLPSRSAGSKGQQIGWRVNILNEEFDFEHCRNFKFLVRISENLLNIFPF